MLKHLKRCNKNLFRIQNSKQKLLSFSTKNDTSGGGNLLAIGYCKEACRNALAKMVIIDELSFKTVEGEGFGQFCRAMQPKFIIPSRVTVARDILQLFEEERVNLKAELRENCK